MDLILSKSSVCSVSVEDIKFNHRYSIMTENLSHAMLLINNFKNSDSDAVKVLTKQDVIEKELAMYARDLLTYMYELFDFDIRKLDKEIDELAMRYSELQLVSALSKGFFSNNKLYSNSAYKALHKHVQSQFLLEKAEKLQNDVNRLNESIFQALYSS